MTSSTLATDDSSLEGLDPCKILLLYEDSAALNKGLQLCQRLTSRFEMQLPFQISQVSFDQLNLDPAADQSITEAAETDILLVCTQDRDLPAWVSDWLSRCARSRTKDQGAFALLVLASSDESMPAEVLLDQGWRAAERLRMDYMPFLSRMEFREAPVDAPPMPVPGSNDYQNGGYTHWGLNE
jgi:hypothetical protein